MTEHESREALRERIAQAVAAHVWAGVAWDHREMDRDGFRRCADRILAILPVAPVVGERERVLEEAARAVCWRCEQDGPAVHREGSGWRHGTEWCVAGQIWYMLAARTPEDRD